jgi:hypothetical protein
LRAQNTCKLYKAHLATQARDKDGIRGVQANGIWLNGLDNEEADTHRLGRAHERQVMRDQQEGH